MSPISDQVAVVTGAGSGIGKAIALALGLKGATLALIGRRIAPLESVVELVRGAGVVAQAFPTDLAREDEVRNLAQGSRGNWFRQTSLCTVLPSHIWGPLPKPLPRS